MKTPTESHASEVLGEILDEIRFCVTAGFGDYIAEYRHVSAKHQARTRANIIHDHITGNALDRLTIFPFVHFIESCGRRLFDVRGELLIHFKRLNDHLLGRNYPTQLALDFSWQNHLPGLPANLPRLTVGYVPNQDWTVINGIFVTYSKGSQLMWAKNLSDDGQELVSLAFPDTPAPIIPKKRVSAKGRSRKQSSG